MPKSQTAKPAAKPKKSEPAKAAKSAPAPKPAGKGGKVKVAAKVPVKTERAEKASKVPPKATVKIAPKAEKVNGDTKHSTRGAQETYFTARERKVSFATPVIESSMLSRRWIKRSFCFRRKGLSFASAAAAFLSSPAVK